MAKLVLVPIAVRVFVVASARTPPAFSSNADLSHFRPSLSLKPRVLVSELPAVTT